MRTYLMAVGLALVTLNGNAQFWNDTGNPTVIPGTNFLGSTNNATLDFRTNNVLRMRLLPTNTTGSINGYTALNLSGHLGLGAFTSGLVAQPFSLLHLDAGGSQDSGFRPWMQSGMTITRQSDQSYFGLKDEGGASNHTVIAWSDNTLAHPGPDRLKFIFVSDNTAANGVAGQLDGLEAARFTPDNVGNQAFFGVGDWLTAGLDPTERVDLLNGRLRIRDLPGDAQAQLPFNMMVVDASAAPSGERGVVKQVSIPALFGLDCRWSLSNTGQNNLSTAFGTASAFCPDEGDAVGIGMDLGGAVAPAKFNLASDRFALVQAVDATMSTANLTGIKVRAVGGQSQETGINVRCEGSGENLAKFGLNVNVETGTAPRTRGVYAVTNGASYTSYAGWFISLDNADYAIGVQGVSDKGILSSTGVSGRSYASAGKNAGVFAFHSAGGASVSLPNGNYGVLAATAGHVTGVDYAGYFDGDVKITGVGTIPGGVWLSSDENLKENIAEITDASAVLQQLSPRSYTYLTEQYPHLGLPEGGQYGFLAQELQEVIPEAVKHMPVQAVMDSLGNEVHPAMETMIINPTTIIPFLVAAFKEQTARIDELEARLEQCCAANPGMAPANGDVKTTPGEQLQEQRLQIIPNPVAELTTWAYHVPKAGKVSLLVSTMEGKPVATLREEMAEAGAYQYTWNTGKLAAGTYLCTYLLDGAVVVQKAVKLK